MVRRLLGILIGFMLLTAIFTGVAAADEHAQEEATGILENIRDFIAQIIAILGVIAVLIGIGFYGMSKKDAGRAQRGAKMIVGGILMIIVGAAVNLIRPLIESFVPEMMGLGLF